MFNTTIVPVILPTGGNNGCSGIWRYLESWQEGDKTISVCKYYTWATLPPERLAELNNDIMVICLVLWGVFALVGMIGGFIAGCSEGDALTGLFYGFIGLIWPIPLALGLIGVALFIASIPIWAPIHYIVKRRENKDKYSNVW